MITSSRMAAKKNQRRNNKKKKGGKRRKNESSSADIKSSNAANTIKKLTPSPDQPKNVLTEYDTRGCVGGMVALITAKCKINYRSLLKYLPEVVHDLRSGAHDSDVVARELMSLYKEQLLRTTNELICLRTPYWQICQWITHLFWPEKDPAPTSPGFDLRKKFVKGYTVHFSHRKGGNKRANLQEAFKTASQVFAADIDTLYYDGIVGSFVSNAVFGLNLEGWIQATQSTHDRVSREAEKGKEKLQEVHALMEQATYFVATGLDDVRDNCWECNTRQERVINVCSRCHVAQYCGKQCQAAAWKRVHKHNCEDLRRRQKSLISSVNCRSLFRGKRLSLPTDQKLIELTIDPFYSDPALRQSGIKGPKLKYFYRNITAIDEGKWWIFPSNQSDEDVLVTGYREDKILLIHTLYLLCYDLEGQAKRKLLAEKDGGISHVDSLAIQAILPTGLYLLHLSDNVFKRDRVHVPPSFLLDHCTPELETDLSGRKKYLVGHTMKMLRGIYDKS